MGEKAVRSRPDYGRQLFEVPKLFKSYGHLLTAATLTLAPGQTKNMGITVSLRTFLVSFY